MVASIASAATDSASYTLNALDRTVSEIETHSGDNFERPKGSDSSCSRTASSARTERGVSRAQRCQAIPEASRAWPEGIAGRGSEMGLAGVEPATIGL